MNKIIFLTTDWSRLTGHDWTGLIMTLTVAVVMMVIYIWVWLPANRGKFEKHRDFVLNDNPFSDNPKESGKNG